MGEHLSLSEALTHAALIVREAALREGYGSDAAWRAADLVVKGGAFSLHAADLAPSGPDACLRADIRCQQKYPFEPIGPDDIAAVHEHMATSRARVLAARAAPSAYRARSIARCKIEELTG